MWWQHNGFPNEAVFKITGLIFEDILSENDRALK
jgi:hypothetical protein